MNSTPIPYHLGCPIWACDHWAGGLFPSDAKRRDYLLHYAHVFNTVEGNSTFYGLPGHDALQRWLESVPEGFCFALKFPRVISHERQLQDAQAETEAFLEILATLNKARRLGPAFLQLPPFFSGIRLTQLHRYLSNLPRDFPYAVEARHFDFYDQGKIEQEFDALLEELGVNKVLLDSRPLFSARPSDATEADAQSRKPKTPVRYTVTGAHPMLRILGRNDPSDLQRWFQPWAQTVAGWIDDGLAPFVFTHAPDERFAPHLARLFHHSMMQHSKGIPPLPPWPGETESARRKKQLELF